MTAAARTRAGHPPLQPGTESWPVLRPEVDPQFLASAGRGSCICSILSDLFSHSAVTLVQLLFASRLAHVDTLRVSI